MEWTPGEAKLGAPLAVPELDQLLERFELPTPSRQLGLIFPPGATGVNPPHRHKADSLLFYPRTHEVPLGLYPWGWVDTVEGRAFMLPGHVLHYVPANNTKEDRYCIVTLFGE